MTVNSNYFETSNLNGTVVLTELFQLDFLVYESVLSKTSNTF